MREIKFRGMHVNETKEWFYGDLINYSTTEFYILEQHFKAWDVLESGCLVRPETVGQYIGSKDKNGQEIYEGDIDCQDNEPMIVAWCEDECCFGLRYPDKKYIDTSISWSCVEVSGNIHENPELLGE